MIFSVTCWRWYSQSRVKDDILSHVLKWYTLKAPIYWTNGNGNGLYNYSLKDCQVICHSCFKYKNVNINNLFIKEMIINLYIDQSQHRILVYKYVN